LSAPRTAHSVPIPYTRDMPDYRRARAPGGTFFFTVVTHERQPILLEPEFRAALREAVARTRTHHPFSIDAWVLLPDHLHTIWTLPEDDGNFSLRWNMVKQLTSKALPTFQDHSKLSPSRVSRRETSIWQRRFWEHQVQDDADFAHCMSYVHFNPVKHGLVSRVQDWEWSTFHRYVAQGVYPERWGEGLEMDGGFGE
jgi:putative transposase